MRSRTHDSTLSIEVLDVSSSLLIFAFLVENDSGVEACAVSGIVAVVGSNSEIFLKSYRILAERKIHISLSDFGLGIFHVRIVNAINVTENNQSQHYNATGNPVDVFLVVLHFLFKS